MPAFLDLFYPPLCLHCGFLQPRGGQPFCSTCQSLLECIDPSIRCPRCFSSDYCLRKIACGQCKKKSLSMNALGAVFDHLGPAATLIQQMKYGGLSYLAKGAAAYLAVQFFALKWPLPDLIVPVPVSTLRFFERGYNQSFELAVALSVYLDRPVHDVLKRKNGGYSQAGLNRQLRVELNQSMFSLKRQARVQDKVVLLVDDVITTGSTLNCCAEVLQEQCPQAIYALAVCRAVKS